MVVCVRVLSRASPPTEGPEHPHVRPLQTKPKLMEFGRNLAAKVKPGSQDLRFFFWGGGVAAVARWPFATLGRIEAEVTESPQPRFVHAGIRQSDRFDGLMGVHGRRRAAPLSHAARRKAASHSKNVVESRSTQNRLAYMRAHECVCVCVLRGEGSCWFSIVQFV